MFTAGRYEYRNKGVDMFIESLARLNYRLQQLGTNVSFLICVPNPATRLKRYHLAIGHSRCFHYYACIHTFLYD